MYKYIGNYTGEICAIIRVLILIISTLELSINFNVTEQNLINLGKLAEPQKNNVLLKLQIES